MELATAKRILNAKNKNQYSDEQVKGIIEILKQLITSDIKKK
tara:strand:+ start:1682 stop:1807 length:126 start_codon:yes stop_codon:yes gene_type:complete